MPENKIKLRGINTPRMDEYFGLWAIEASRGQAMFNQARGVNLAEHVESTAAPRPSTVKGIKVVAWDGSDPDDPDDDDGDGDGIQQATTGNIAVLMVVGTLMKQQSSLDASTSTIMLRRHLRQVAADPRFQGCIICFDTPGGSVSGTADAAADIAALAEKMPVIAHVQDLCASAGEWLACQCTEVYANHGTALVGSIGTFIGLYDCSKAAEKEGIEAKVYATGPLKGAGFPGTAITPEQDAQFQKIVDETQKFFSRAVAEGRDMSAGDVAKIATGGVFMADEGVENGLLDGIKTFDQCVARMGELIAARGAVTTPGIAAGISGGRMATEEKPGPAAPTSAAEITKPDGKRFVEAFGHNGAVWFVEGKTFEEATALHNAETSKRIKALEDANAALVSKNAELEASVKELRGDAAPVSASLPPDPAAKATVSKDPGALESRVGANIAAASKLFQVKKSA